MSERTDTISASLDRLLSRLTPPRGLTPQAQLDETAALMRAIDRAAPGGGLDVWWTKFEDALLGAQETRAWPTVFEVQRAANSMLDRDKAARSASTANDDEIAYQHMVEFWVMCRTIRRAVARPGFVERMVREKIATWGEVLWSGADIPRWAFEIADRENRDKSDAVLEQLRRSTAHLRAEGAPRGDTRSRRDPSQQQEEFA